MRSSAWTGRAGRRRAAFGGRAPWSHGDVAHFVPGIGAVYGSENRSELRGELVVVGETAEYGMSDKPAGRLSLLKTPSDRTGLEPARCDAHSAQT